VHRSHDGDAGDADVVVRQLGTEDGGRRPHGGFADRERSQGRDRIVGEAATGKEDGAASCGAHGRGSDLGGHDSAHDIDVVGLVQVGDVAAEQRVWRGLRRVVDEDPGAPVDGQPQTDPVPHRVRYAVGGNRIDLVLDEGAKSSLWWATMNEWLGLLDVSSLELEHLYGGFEGEPFDEDSREYVFVARR
jgi:hypothetical protein